MVCRTFRSMSTWVTRADAVLSKHIKHLALKTAFLASMIPNPAATGSGLRDKVLSAPQMPCCSLLLRRGQSLRNHLF